jgi:hypothetical protein
LKSALWRRRRRLPVSMTVRSEVDICTPNVKVKAHPCTRAGSLTDDFGGRLPRNATLRLRDRLGGIYILAMQTRRISQEWECAFITFLATTPRLFRIGTFSVHSHAP